MSSLASIEQAILQLFVGTVPAGVKVTTLTVQQATSSKTRGRRVNLAFLRVAMDPAARNMPSPRAGGAQASPTLALHLDYLISVHTSDYTTPDTRAAALIENVIRTVESHPILATTPAESTATQGRSAATLTIVDQSIQEWAQLWTALQTPWQPAILLRVRVT